MEASWAEVIVYLSDNKTIKYRREAALADRCRGSIGFSASDINKISKFTEFIERMKTGELVYYSDDFIEIDDFVGSLMKQYGNDFIPDEEEEWYEYDWNEKRDPGHPRMCGADGFNTFLYWEEYHENQKELASFIEKCQKISENQINKMAENG